MSTKLIVFLLMLMLLGAIPNVVAIKLIKEGDKVRINIEKVTLTSRDTAWYDIGHIWVTRDAHFLYIERSTANGKIFVIKSDITGYDDTVGYIDSSGNIKFNADSAEYGVSPDPGFNLKTDPQKILTAHRAVLNQDQGSQGGIDVDTGAVQPRLPQGGSGGAGAGSSTTYSTTPSTTPVTLSREANRDEVKITIPDVALSSTATQQGFTFLYIEPNTQSGGGYIITASKPGGNNDQSVGTINPDGVIALTSPNLVTTSPGFSGKTDITALNNGYGRAAAASGSTNYGNAYAPSPVPFYAGQAAQPQTTPTLTVAGKTYQQGSTIQTANGDWTVTAVNSDGTIVVTKGTETKTLRGVGGTTLVDTNGGNEFGVTGVTPPPVQPPTPPPGTPVTSLTAGQTYTSGTNSVYVLGQVPGTNDHYIVTINGVDVEGVLANGVLTVGNQKYILAQPVPQPTPTPQQPNGGTPASNGALLSFGPGGPTATVPGAVTIVPPAQPTYTVYTLPDGSTKVTLGTNAGYEKINIQKGTLTEAQFNLLKEQGASGKVTFDGTNVIIVQEKKDGNKIVGTTTYTLGWLSVAGVGSSPVTTKVMTKGDGNSKVAYHYVIDDAGKETLTEVKDGAGKPAPFDSEKFTRSDKGDWLYDGKEGDTKKVPGAIIFPDGGYAHMVGDTLVEKKADGGGFVYKLTKNGKSTTVPGNLIPEIGNQAMTTDVYEKYMNNLPDYLTLIKNNRFKQEDYAPDKDGRLVPKGGTGAKIYQDPNKKDNYIIEGGDISAPQSDYSKVTYVRNADGTLSVKESESKPPGGKLTRLVWKDPTHITLRGEDGQDKTYEFIKIDNAEVYCSGNDCYHPGTNTFYTRDGNKLTECTTAECKKLAEQMAPHLEKKRKGEGGQTDTERTALRWLSALEAGQSGFGSFSSLFIGDEAMAKWRAQVDDFFCSTILLGGKECWVSEICAEYIPRSQKSTLIIQAPTGEFIPVAHIEASKRTVAYQDGNQTPTEYLYTISFGLRNPEESEQEIVFNVLLRGPRSRWLWQDDNGLPKDEKLAEGAEFKKAGKDMALLYLNEEYTQVCLVFNTGIPNADGETIGQLCNAIVPTLG